MKGQWLVCLWLVGVSITPALAEIYRWTDATGKVHFTDNPEAIPPAYRPRSTIVDPGTSAPAPAVSSPPTTAPAPTVRPSPPTRPPDRVAPPGASFSSSAPSQRLQLAEINQKITLARQERQTYFDQLGGTRGVQTTPEFVRQRRQLADFGRSLLAIEQQLDTLFTARDEVQQRLDTQQETQANSTSIVFDQDGHDALYWQRRASTLREQVQQAYARRRDLLSQLSTSLGDEPRGGERILLRAQALQQNAQDIDSAEGALQTMQQEARQAGAPAEWWR